MTKSQPYLKFASKFGIFIVSLTLLHFVSEGVRTSKFALTGSLRISNMQERFTKQGMEKLKKELEYLKKVKTKEIAKQINYAASFGDLSENAAYTQAKEAKAFCVGRILELEKILNNAKVIDESKGSEKVQVGSVVTVETNGNKDTLQIVGSEEADSLKNKISYKSPLGKELCGKKENDTAEVQTPSGEKLNYKIIKIL